MASEKRIGRVAEQIRKELGTLILRGAVRDGGFITISEVRLSKDLGYARVFVSILGEESERQRAFKRLKAAGRELRMGLASRLRIRAVPELQFQLDESLDRVENVDRLLRQIEDERGDGEESS